MAQVEPDRVLTEALAEIEATSDLTSLEAIRVRLLGRKGEVTAHLRAVSSLPKDERPAAGQAWNRVRGGLEGALEAREAALGSPGADTPSDDDFDFSLPGRRPPEGLPHVLMQTLDRLVEIFRSLGFSVADGPEVETTHYNFTALNIPEDHPTRDDHDSFFLAPDLLLRTQMSPVQIRTMEAQEPPVRVISPGRVYRRDHFDASHSPFFFQMEGLYVDTDVTLGDLKGTLREFVRRFFGKELGMRFRGSYFPFTEPSLELDISCTVCEGQGCAVCKQTGWVEILGCGMVHPNVLRGVGYDPEVVSGYAFGMGPDRITMLRHRIPDIRHLYENDLRFLSQFRGAS
ncbi:MAG: phenylalanine--tRNA ligase alpha subunit [Gemmatimonadota bacterium]|nr:MAG: phenylalanine--tRNA ligase alpha subunit [Gemmatimonadota bacterium]